MKENDAKEVNLTSFFDSFESEVINYDKDAIVRNLIAAGAKRINNCKITKAIVFDPNPDGRGMYIQANLNRTVPGISKEGVPGSYTSCFFWDNEYTINLLGNEEYGALAADAENFSAEKLCDFMYDSEIDVLCELVPVGEWKNPFRPNSTPKNVDSPFVKIHIINVIPGSGARDIRKAKHEGYVKSYS